MTPPADGNNAKNAATSMQTTLTETSLVFAQTNNVSTVPITPDVAPAESEDEEEDEMVDALEDLILEAYNNMQIDGEYIFLPEKVAEKLHQIADQIKLKQREEEQQTENNTIIEEDSNSGDDSAHRAQVEEAKVPQQKTLTDAPESEQKQEQKQEKTQGRNAEKASVHDECAITSEGKKTRLRKVLVLQAKVAERRREEQHKQRIPRVLSMENIFTELASVPEIDESASSGPPSPSPPLSRSHSGANTPKMRSQASAQGRGRFSSPPLMPLTSSPSANSGHIPMSRTPDQSGGSKQKGKVLTYGTRREAALRQKEDKKKRELLVRETARKQREDSKRQLEEAHQREIEEKRERVRRIREERLHRRTGKSTGVKGTKKKG